MRIQLGGVDYPGNTTQNGVQVFFRVMEGLSVQILTNTGQVLHTAVNREAAVMYVESHGLAMMTTEPRRFTVARRILSKVGYDELYTPSIVAHWVCLQCSGQRGELHAARVYNGSHWRAVDGWHNPCGHIEKYDEVLASATFDPHSD